MIALRVCDQDDLSVLQEIYQDVYSEVKFVPKFENLRRFREMFSREDIYFDRSLIAIDDDAEGKVVGFIFVGVREKLARISALGVLPEYRNRGIARRLLNRLIRDLREIEDVNRIVVEVMHGSHHCVRLFSEYGFDTKRTLYTLFRLCPEREAPKSKFKITTEFPSELLKHHETCHEINQPWVRNMESLLKYNKNVVGYATSVKGKTLAYVLMGFDHTILDLAINLMFMENQEPVFELMYHIFSRFESLITIDVPEDDELFDVYGKTGFETVYKKIEMDLSFQSYD